MRTRAWTCVGVLSALVSFVACAVSTHSLDSPAEDAVPSATADPGAINEGAWPKAPDATASAIEGGAGFEAGSGGSAPIEGSGGSAGTQSGNVVSDASVADVIASSGGLCPSDWKYASEYFAALKINTQIIPCTATSCTTGNCCYKQKLCVPL